MYVVLGRLGQVGLVYIVQVVFSVPGDIDLDCLVQVGLVVFRQVGPGSIAYRLVQVALLVGWVGYPHALTSNSGKKY